MPLAVLWTTCRRGLNQLRRQWLTQGLSLLTMAVALGLMGLALGLWVQMTGLSRELGEQFRLVAYLDHSAKVDQVALVEKLSAWPEVKAIRLVTTRESLQRLKAVLGDQAGLLEGLGPEVLPAALEIHLQPAVQEASTLEALVRKLQGLSGVVQVASGQALAERLFGLVTVLRRFGLWLFAALALGGVFVIFATIRLSLSAHQAEIDILKLIGATPWFIRGPYLVQGAIQGLLAGLLALAGLVALQLSLNLAFHGLPLGLDLLSWRLSLSLPGLGAALGLAGSGWALAGLKDY